MPQFASAAPAPYIQPVAKTAARMGDGPWGEAIQYWFKEKQLRQAHVVEGTGMAPNKVSRAANGLNVRMDTLRQIAEFLNVPFESVLVSPLRRLSPSEERHVAERIAAAAARELTQRRPAARAAQAGDPRAVAWAQRMSKLPAKLQKSLIEVLKDYERTARREARDGRKPRRP
jgi:transcriptional regulator with XRE-family HTH domain